MKIEKMDREEMHGLLIPRKNHLVSFLQIMVSMYGLGMFVAPIGAMVISLYLKERRYTSSI